MKLRVIPSGADRDALLRELAAKKQVLEMCQRQLAHSALTIARLTGEIDKTEARLRGDDSEAPVPAE